ncbi:hypothetical protein PG994_008877 [Apiospora phragmitis]|uniref:RDD domain-containing protein n=1 Tax=Apiospora phragmitis TaxID=2905665 RepID=A0ABR1UKQ7_9PEZI
MLGIRRGRVANEFFRGKENWAPAVVDVLILITVLVIELVVVMIGTSGLSLGVRTIRAKESHVISVPVTRKLDLTLVAAKLLSPTTKQMYLGGVLRAIRRPINKPVLKRLFNHVIVNVLSLRFLATVHHLLEGGFAGKGEVFDVVTNAVLVLIAVLGAKL